MEEKVRCERNSSLLIVEDDESQLQTLTAIMQEEGFDVIGCSTAAEAIEHLKHLDTGVVVLDLRLPDLSGTQLLERLADATDRISVIINTAYSSYESAKDALNLGAFAYVEKAGDPDELLRYVHRAFQASLRSYADELETAVAERTHDLLQANESLKEEINERELTEEALRASEEKYKDLFENAGEGIITLDLDGRITGANKLVEEYGFNRAELIGRQLFEFVPEYDKARSVSDFQALIADRRVQGQMDVITPKGIISVDYRDTPIVRAGEVIGVQAILTDITGRKRAEERIEFLGRILETSPISVIATDENVKIIYVNPATENLFGYESEELIGKDPGILNVEPDADKMQMRMLDTMRQKEVWKGELLNKKKNGERFYIQVSCCQLLDEEGNFVALVGFQEDITERKRVEEALRESEEKFRNLAEKSPNMIFINKAGRIVYANQKSEEIMGYTKQEFCSPDFDFLSLISPEHTDLVRSSFNIHMTGEDVPPREYSLITKQGQRIETIISTRLIRYDGQNAILGIVTDITKRKKAEEALRRSERQASAAIEAARALTFNYNIATGKVDWGGAIEEITGYTPEEFALIDVDGWAERLHPDDRDRVLSILQEAIQVKDRATAEYRFRTKKGDYVILSSISLTEKKSGKAVRLVGILQDVTERKKAEEALRESQENYRMVSELTSDYIIKTKVEPDGQMVLVSATDRFEKMTGYSVDELRSQSSWSKIVHPDDYDKFQDFWKRIVSSRKSCELEFRGINREQEFEWMHAYGQPILDEKNDRVISIVFTAKDITERKLAEEAYRSLVDHSLQGLAIFQEGRAVFANQAMADITGYTVGEMLTMPSEQVQAFVHPDDRELVWNRHRDRLNGEELPERYEFRGIRKDGSMCWVEIHASRIEYQGKPAIQAAYVDITERKKAEEQIEKLAKFPAENPNPVLRISGRGTVVYANKASAILLKAWSCSVGKSVTDRWHELVMDSLSSGQSQQTEVKCDGRIFSLTFAPVVDTNYVNVYGHDITERKKAEEDIRNLAKFPEENTSPVYRISKDGVLLYANSASRRLIFEDLTEIGNKIPEKWLGMIKNVYDSGKRQQVELELSGRVFLFEQVPVIEGGYVNSYATDITERKKAEKRLLEHQAKLKAMASEMLLTEEHERQRLAVGLHDEVCQKLVLTKLALESSLNLVSDSNLLASLRIACGGIGETIEQADSLTFELSNPVLRVFGFVVALEKYLTEVIRQKHGIEYELQSDEQLSTLPDEIKNCLFRVTRELLTNVVKHAHAHKVKVSARESQSQIYVRVQDDGVGFEESQAGAKVSQTARFGLFSIREQLEYLGGHLEIESGPGRGTTATVVVPLRDKAVV